MNWKIPINHEENLLYLLHQAIETTGIKDVIKALGIVCAQNGMPVAYSMLSLLAGQKDVDNVEAILCSCLGSNEPNTIPICLIALLISTPSLGFH